MAGLARAGSQLSSDKARKASKTCRASYTARAGGRQARAVRRGGRRLPRGTVKAMFEGMGLPRRSGELDSDTAGCGGYPLARRQAPEASEELVQ